jgi:drug/metabolite transporter (DMT)-like permease
VTGLGGTLLSFDIPLIRLADGGPWSILLVRSGLSFLAAILAWAVWSLASGRFRPIIHGRIGLAVAALYSLSSITFILAVYNTTTANLVFILAFNTAFSALLSWVFLKERPRTGTLIAMGFMLLGVGIIVHEGISSGHLFGDAMAMLSAFILSLAITVSRGSGKDMGFAAIVSTIVPFLLAAAAVPGEGFAISHPAWIVLNGAIVLPVAFFCLAVGPRLLSGPEVAMFYLLETIFAPVWVWMIFKETPSRQSIVGGTILIVALVVHSLWRLNGARKQAQAALPPYPV